MAKKVKTRKLQKEFDYENYAKGDALFDLLRSYYIATGEIHTDKWTQMCKNDIENRKKQKKTKINDKRNYNI
ncbi:MAG: hypothetical protein ACLR3R_08995 [Clostridium paraputrificum]